MEYIKSEEANEDLLFREEVMRQFEYFYQYMHGDRKEPNEVETIFKRSIEFFGADWIGLIDFDLEVGAWSTRCFYNKRTGSSTETMIEDAENAAQAKRWEQAIRGGKPIVIEDIESIREEAPEEYAMYKRLLDERTYSILCRRLQLELNISDEVLETCQESKMIFLRLDEEKRKFI